MNIKQIFIVYAYSDKTNEEFAVAAFNNYKDANKIASESELTTRIGTLNLFEREGI